jgi:hypothetical protein
MGSCHRCDQPVPDEQLGAHLRAAHPDVAGAGFETWPDGGLVIVDLDPTPVEFTDPPQEPS